MVIVLVLIGFIFISISYFVLHHRFEQSQVTVSTSPRGGVGWVEAVVVVDNTPSLSNSNLLTAWGLSIYIRIPDMEILFDTGPSPNVLRYNAERLGVNLSRIDVVVLSHEHGDHVGGLQALNANSVAVYGAPGTPANRVVNNTLEISPGIYILKPLYGPPWETSLLINVNGYGGILFVGCSHPGIVNIVQNAVKIARVKTVIGGLHLAGASEEECISIVEKLKALGVEKIGAIHCSGDTIRNILAKENMLLNIHVGSRIMVSKEGGAFIIN
ncbi:MAG: hypothetical protein B7O98_08625 [Zestosphaera tikiterensis]|uniref:Metallo-beta-lactamase domain-containing protein n=1 Tax=Zestosphaera tikiterensis TaxID=1973259 RepID=A0A2R7Y348_9CREN|nr:MAG: hypothetical protein B7O98_08625 [Zestosphaera tikiterensis]